MQLYEKNRLFRYIASFWSCTPICNIRCNSRQEAEPASPLCPLTVFTGGEVFLRSVLSKPTPLQRTFPPTPFFTLLRVERKQTPPSENSKRAKQASTDIVVELASARTERKQTPPSVKTNNGQSGRAGFSSCLTKRGGVYIIYSEQL